MSEKMSTVYVEPTSEAERKESHVLNKRFVRCIHCQKESPLNPRGVGRGWPEYSDPLREVALKANPLMPEELIAQEAVTALQREYAAALADVGKLLSKVNKAHGHQAIDEAGQVVSKGRDDGLIGESEPLMRVAQKHLDETEENLRAARVRLGKLHRARTARIEGWKIAKEKELADERAKRTKGKGSEWTRRLRELLEG